MSLARLFRLLIAGLFTSAIIVGCASIPQSGQIGESDQQANVDQNVAYTFNPAGPAQDATQTSVIKNRFILAATGIQGDFSTAREFPTEDVAEKLHPSAQTTIYTGKPIVDSNGGDQYSVEVILRRVSGPGGCFGTSRWRRNYNFDFSLVQVNGQWRIDELPDGIKSGLCTIPGVVQYPNPLLLRSHLHLRGAGRSVDAPTPLIKPPPSSKHYSTDRPITLTAPSSLHLSRTRNSSVISCRSPHPLPRWISRMKHLPTPQYLRGTACNNNWNSRWNVILGSQMYP